MKQHKQHHTNAVTQRIGSKHAAAAQTQTSFAANSVTGIAQQKLAAIITTSPRFLAQRKQIESLTNKSSQRNFIAANQTLQRKMPTAHAYTAQEADATMQDKQIAPSTGPATVQRVTGMDIVGEENYDTTQVIGQLHHARAAVHGWARTRAMGLGPFATVGAHSVCNHHKSYENLQNEFAARNVNHQKISDAANNTLVSYGALPGMPAAYAAHKTVLETARDDAEVERSAFHNSMNYYVQKICDYPRNLFFWPNKTDTEPDQPLTSYTSAALPGIWAYRVAVTTNHAKAALANERARVVAGAAAVTTAIN